jgi:hypothetical protein
LSNRPSEDLRIKVSQRRRPYERLGQAYMNVLRDYREDLYQQVTGTRYDPFYDDNRISSFLSWVDNNWDITINIEVEGLLLW